jgi:hypothetical protein
MATTNFVQFNPGAANQETDAQYLADAQRIAGYGTDQIVPSPLLNKATYQPTTFCAAFGQMLANKGFTNSDASVSALAAVLANILTTADLLPDLISVAYSPTPSFNAAASNGFQMTLGGNISSSSCPGITAGQLLAFYFAQDSAGSRTVNWPAVFTGTVQPDPTPNSVSVILFRADLGGTARAVSPLISNNGVFFGSPVAALAGLTAPTVSSSDNSTNAATTAWCLLGFAVSIGATGYIKFPVWLGGLILQWVKGLPLSGSQGGSVYTANFAIAFPNACVWAGISGVAAGTDYGESPCWSLVGMPTSTAASYYYARNADHGGMTVTPMILAIGN